MSIFLAPVPINHVQAMLNDLSQSHARFAFGSNAIEFFEKTFSRNCEADNIEAYIYVSKTGGTQVESSINLGIFIKARLCGWSVADRRGQYPKSGTARRPASTFDDTPVALFWEIDKVERLPGRKLMSDFISEPTSRRYTDDYVPHGPLLVDSAR